MWTTWLSAWTLWLLKARLRGCPETSVTNHQCTLRNIPEKRRPRVQRSLLQYTFRDCQYWVRFNVYGSVHRKYTAVLCSWSGRPARPRTQHDCHHDTMVKPEAATAVNELLMMGGRAPETCWAVNKCQDNKQENCCIWLVIYLNCTMMHGLKKKR